MKQIKQNKSIFLVVGFVLLLSGAFFLGSILTMHNSEVKAASAVAQDLEERSEKDITAESDAFLQTSKETARSLLEECPDCPLLDENATEHFGDSSLENILYDINAGGDAKQAILDVCQDNGIDASTAKIKDLTVEQITEIDKRIFLSSDHPISE